MPLCLCPNSLVTSGTGLFFDSNSDAKECRKERAVSFFSIRSPFKMLRKSSLPKLRPTGFPKSDAITRSLRDGGHFVFQKPQLVHQLLRQGHHGDCPSDAYNTINNDLGLEEHALAVLRSGIKTCLDVISSASFRDLRRALAGLLHAPLRPAGFATRHYE